MPADKRQSTEKSITVKRGGRWYNLPTIQGGKEYPPRQAAKQAQKAGKLGKSYATSRQAVAEAIARSRFLGDVRREAMQVGHQRRGESRH